MKIIEWVASLKAGYEQILEVRREVEEMSTPDRTYYVLAVVSAVIATYGLLSDSTAVVIGAMLVAPLMGPIFGIALSLVSLSRRLLFRSIVSETTGVLLVLLIGFVLMRFGPEVGLGQEVLSRTKPTILDIAIALASGLAGAFALVNVKVNAALPGVAISTALVPPLAACGICLGAEEYRLAGGAFILFLANFLAIELAAAMVFTLYGYRRERESTKFLGLFKQYGWSVSLLLVMSFYLYRTLSQTVQENQLKVNIGDVLDDLSSEIPGAHLDDFSITNGGARIDVSAVFLTPQSIDSASVAAIEKRLQDKIDKSIHLVVRSLISSDADGRGPVYVSQDKIDAEAQARSRSEYFRTVRTGIESYLARVTGASLDALTIPYEHAQTEITVVVNTPTAISPEQVAEMQELLSAKTGRLIDLTVRSLITIDADSGKYIYAPADPPEPTAQERAYTDRITRALQNQLPQQVVGAYLVSVAVVEKEDGWIARAVCRSPAAITPEMVAEIEEDIHKYVSPDIQLVVRTVLESDASSGGYLSGD